MSSALHPRVLVVEDDRDIAFCISDALRPHGFEVQLAENGDDALAICVEWIPDAIVLDHNLPVMTGEEFLQEIRWRPGLSRVPVLLISALADVGAIARRLHVRHWLAKPFDPEGLVERVVRAIATRTAPHAVAQPRLR